MEQPMTPFEQVKSLDVSKRAFSLWEEFKNFAFKGNVVDLAVGVIIGTAFANIIKSLVDNIIMPIISLVMPGDARYENWAWQVGEKTIPYGHFLASLLNFMIVAFVLFLFIIKFLRGVMHTKQEEAVKPPPPTREQELLMEIRDLLKQERSTKPN
jgi:large conductance mechanosensitive channel